MQFARPEIAAIAGYAPGEQPQDGGFIKLNTNENPYPPSTAIHAAIEEVLHRGLQKYPDPLAGAFRRRAAEMLGVPPDWILCGNGSDDILTIATRTFVGQGQRLRLPYPSYILYRTLAQLQGAQSEEVLFEPDWSLSPSFAAAAADLRLVFLPNPNSPSGTVVPPEAILALAEQLPCPLLVDEAYADFAEQNCMHLVAKCEKILVSRTLSKSYALAGLRFGYVVGQPHLIREMEKVKDSYNCDALSIAVATAAHRRSGVAGSDPGHDSRDTPAIGRRHAQIRVCNSRVAKQFHLERTSRISGTAALRGTQTAPHFGPIHGLSGLGRRPADQRGNRPRNRHLLGAIEHDALSG